MTDRRVASLTSGLLARKGTAKPADLAAEVAEASVSPAPVVPSPAPADVADRNAAAERDLRAYAWPTQGAPGDDDLAMPVPPIAVDPAEEAAAAVRRRGTARRLAIFGIAASVVAAVVVIVVRDGRQDAVRLAATAPAGVTAMPSPPAVAPDVAASRAMEDAARTVRDVAPAGVAARPSPATVAPHKAAHRPTKDAARTVRDIAPAAGSPSPPSSAEFELAPRIPPAPAMKIAALPPATTESSAPVSAAALAPPPIDLPPEKATSVAPAPVPKPRVAARVPATKKTAKATAGGRYAVQVASIGSQARAAAERARLARHLGPVLGGRALIVEQASVAGHGTVYRIRAAGYPNQAAAKKACTQIKGRGQGCLVVRL